MGGNMKIKRNGQEYELTEKELFQAYLEQEHIWDVDYVSNWSSDWEEFDDMSKDELLDAIDEIAYKMRRIADKTGISDFDALTTAIEEYLEERNND